MSTVRTSGSRDPPQTTTNVVGLKRIRKTVTLVAGAGALTLGDVRSCLPITTPELRILKISVWGPDGGQISCVFPASISSAPGADHSVWVDEGTTGQQRAQIHLQPNFAYRNHWFELAALATDPIATFGSLTLTASLIVDLTVQYRTAVQSCPALDYLRVLQSEQALCEELFFED